MRNVPLRPVCLLFAIAVSAFLGTASMAASDFTAEVLKGAAIGAAVTAAAPQLNKFVNTITFQNKVPRGIATKVVPIVSVGEKGYAGAAQVAGPAAAVGRTKVVWVYEDNFSENEFRLRILFPSASVNPFALQRVQGVGVTAVIDVSLDGRWRGETVGRDLTAGDILKAGAVAVAVNAAADPVNNAINTITKGSQANTKVVPAISVGEKAYIGGVQVSGPSRTVQAVKAGYQYEAAFDSGKFRVRAFVPSDSVNPLKIHRVSGVGMTALIDTSITDQERVRQRQAHWQTVRVRYPTIEVSLRGAFKEFERDDERHDRGRHLGWEIGKGNQDKEHDNKERGKKGERGKHKD